VEADLDNLSSIIPAFSNVEGIFAVTDFWAPFFASYRELSQISDRATGEFAAKIEIQRGKNIVDAAVQVLKGGILERFIFSTLPDFNKQSKGKYTFNYHFDGKAAISEYLKSKTDLWEISSLFNAGFYTTNMLKLEALRGERRSVGGKYFLSNPGSPSALHPFFVPDDTGIFVELLVRSPPKQDLLGVSEMASYETYIKTWTDVTGIPSAAVEHTVEEGDKRIPGGLGREAAESQACSAEFGWGDHLIFPTEVSLMVRCLINVVNAMQLDPNIKTTSLKEYMENENWVEFLTKI
jgi:hypothetical protein